LLYQLSYGCTASLNQRTRVSFQADKNIFGVKNGRWKGLPVQVAGPQNKIGPDRSGPI
jgi:hypothetical protein